MSTHAPRFVMLLVVTAAVACEAPAVGVTPSDADANANADADDATIADDADADDGEVRVLPDVVVLPDGRRCSPHDEDGDGFPDDCDDCPGLPDPEQKLGAPSVVGASCRALPPFDAATKRVFFDPFFEIWDRSWTFVGGDVGAFQIDDTRDRLVGGTAIDHLYRYGIANVGTGASTTVVTAVLDKLLGGISGNRYASILVRAAGDPKRLVQCFRGAIGGPSPVFGVIVMSADACTGSAGCVYDVIKTEVVPTELDTDQPTGLRASITSGAPPASTGTVQCLVFDPKIPGSVHTGDPRYVVSVDLDATQWIAAGDVGVGVFQEQQHFEWIEVLSE